MVTTNVAVAAAAANVAATGNSKPANCLRDVTINMLSADLINQKICRMKM